MQPPDVNNDRRKFSRTEVLEATAAAIMAAAIMASAGGVSWLVVQLPNRLQQLEASITRILENQDTFNKRFSDIEKQVQDHDRRIIRLELR